MLKKITIFRFFCFLAGTIILFFQPLFGQKLPPKYLDFFHFRSIGPTRQGGRISDFAVCRQNSKIFYVAAASGGLWKTVNGGTSFKPIFDHEDICSIGDVAVAPSDCNLVWVGSGEANLRNSTYYGNGIYKSTDGGRTWKNMGLKESHHIGRIVIHPTNPDIVYVAAQGHLYTENPERGLYKTTDAGLTWKKILEVRVEGRYIGVTDVVMDPHHPDTLYAAAYDRQRFPWSFRTAGPGSGIYKTTDGGQTWQKLEKG
ncbi:MAG: WD40/YVTN/BNR-like repeat-containing protein, partial [bacterium]